jgi:hypothetical protein
MTDIEVEAFEEMYTPEEREEIHKQVEENIRMPKRGGNFH